MLGMPTCFMAAARASSAENAWAVFWVSPLWSLVLGGLLVSEWATPRTWALSLVALAGSVLVFAERPVPGVAAVLWALGMAFCFALYLVLARLMRHETTESKLFYVALGVFLSLTPAMRGLFVPPDLRAASGMAAIGLVGLGSLFLIDRALEGGSISSLAPFAFAVVPCLVGFEALLGAVMARRFTLGAVLVAAALAIRFRYPDP
jgi:drug/metabolite transporter (DMT)-like permease